jgi:hypothetical protein
VEYNIDTLVAAHRARKSDNTLLAVNEPAHGGSARRSRVLAARPRFFGTLPEQERGDRETSVERINELRSLALLPNVFPLKLRYHYMARTVIGHELLYLDCIQFQLGLNHERSPSHVWHMNACKPMVMELPESHNR